MSDLTGFELAGMILGFSGLLIAAFGVVEKRRLDRLTREIEADLARKDAERMLKS